MEYSQFTTVTPPSSPILRRPRRQSHYKQNTHQSSVTEAAHSKTGHTRKTYTQEYAK
jgi:hypothetical protein